MSQKFDAQPLDSDVEASTEQFPIEKVPYDHAFPEGGLKAWSVAVGASFVLFSTFGYANAFG